MQYFNIHANDDYIRAIAKASNSFYIRRPQVYQPTRIKWYLSTNSLSIHFNFPLINSLIHFMKKKMMEKIQRNSLLQSKAAAPNQSNLLSAIF